MNISPPIFQHEPSWGLSYSISIEKDIPKLNISLLAEQENLTLSIPNLRLGSVKHSQENILEFTYYFGPSPRTNHPTVLKEKEVGRLYIDYIFLNDKLNEFFPNEADYTNPDAWKREIGMDDVGIDIRIMTPDFFYRRSIGDLDFVDHPEMRGRIYGQSLVLFHLNSALLQFPKLQSVMNSRKRRAISTIKPLLMEQAARPPGTFGEDNEGGPLYKRGLANFTKKVNQRSNNKEKQNGGKRHTRKAL